MVDIVESCPFKFVMSGAVGAGFARAPRGRPARGDGGRPSVRGSRPGRRVGGRTCRRCRVCPRWRLWICHGRHEHEPGADERGPNEAALPRHHARHRQAEQVVRAQLWHCWRSLRWLGVRHRVGEGARVRRRCPRLSAHADARYGHAHHESAWTRGGGGPVAGVVQYRAKHDMVNSVSAGCFTGAVLAARAGPQAAGLGCVGFAAFSAAVDYFLEHNNH